MYEPYPPETVGRERRLVLGKHAGRAGVKAALAEHDVAVDNDELSEVVGRVKELGDRGKRVTDADLLAITEDVQGRERDRHVELVDLSATSGGNLPTASVRLRIGDNERVASGTGSGPVDAGLEAVRARWRVIPPAKASPSNSTRITSTRSRAGPTRSSPSRSTLAGRPIRLCLRDRRRHHPRQRRRDGRRARPPALGRRRGRVGAGRGLARRRLRSGDRPERIGRHAGPPATAARRAARRNRRRRARR